LTKFVSMKTFGRDLITKIQQAKLEGEEAHKIYSPPYRPLFSYEEILTRNPKFAAVNILLYLKNNNPNYDKGYRIFSNCLLSF